MSEGIDQKPDCEHAWEHKGTSTGLWIPQCCLCGAFDDADLSRQIAKIKADALREAANELEDREHCYNDAMSAAFVSGETGRGNVIHAYEAILEDPYGWLRDRAKEIEGEA